VSAPQGYNPPPPPDQPVAPHWHPEAVVPSHRIGDLDRSAFFAISFLLMVLAVVAGIYLFLVLFGHVLVNLLEQALVG
jgi:hypothetical protein